MTTVNFNIQVPGPSGRIAAQGRVSWRPLLRVVSGTAVVEPVQASVPLVGGVATAEIDPGVYLFVEESVGGQAAYRIVPGSSPVDYSSLVAVDPATLEPAAAPDPGWLAMARSTVTTGSVVGNDLVLTRSDGTTVDAGNVRGPQGLQGVQGVQGNTGSKGDPGDMVGVYGPSNVSGTVGLGGPDLPSMRLWTMTGDITLNLPTPSGAVSGSIVLVLTQDATGGRVMNWPGSIKWPGNVSQQPSSAPNSVSVARLLWTGVQWIGQVFKDNTLANDPSLLQTYVRFVDLAGNPISARHVLIKVDTSTWDIADIVAEA